MCCLLTGFEQLEKKETKNVYILIIKNIFNRKTIKYC